MVVKVQIDSQAGQRTGDWAVKSGRRTLSRHRTKDAALSRGRIEARQRGTVLKAQQTNGTWRTVASY